MTTTLPTPSHGAEYTNSVTGDKFKYDSDTGAWEGFEGIDESGDSMTGTIAYPDMLINGNTLTASDFVAGGGEIDMTAWTSYFVGDKNTSWESIAYGNGRFVAVASKSPYSSERVAYSEDGINWNTVAPLKGAYPEAVKWYSVTFGNGKFVAVGWGHAMYSEDGITWSLASTNMGAFKLTGVAYGDGKFVAVPEYAYNGIWYSEDAITWTKTNGTDESAMWGCIAYGDGKFVALALTSGKTMLSNDGIKWTAASRLPDSIGYYSVAYAAGKFVAITPHSSPSAPVAYSEDGGMTWTNVPATTDESNQWYSVTYGAGKWVAVARSGSNRVMYSEDAINWTGVRSSNESNNWEGITYGDGKFVAVAWSGPKGADGNPVNARFMVLDAPDIARNLYFNGDPVVVDKGQTRTLAKSVSGLSSLLGSSRYYQAEEPSDSFGIDNGTLWLNPSNAKLSIYYDSDWNQLN